MDDESTTDKGTTRRSSSDEEPVALVMDVGGNWIRVALTTNGGDLVWRDRIATQAHQSGRAVTARIEAQFDKGIAEVGSRKIVGVGLGLAGPVDHKTGTIHSPPNIPGLDGVSFKALWKDKVKCPRPSGERRHSGCSGRVPIRGGSRRSHTCLLNHKHWDRRGNRHRRSSNDGGKRYGRGAGSYVCRERRSSMQVRKCRLSGRVSIGHGHR